MNNSVQKFRSLQAMYRWILFIFFLLAIEFYSYQAIRTSFENKWINRIYLLISILIMLFILISIFNFDRREGLNSYTATVLTLFLLVYIPKILISVFLLTEDMIRLVWGITRHFTSSVAEETFLPERRKFISRSLLALAAIPFGSIVYGIWKGRYNYRILKTQVFFDDLPDEFDGFTILQLSDIHCGSFDNPEKIQYGIDLINEQNFDMLVFTGDLVNSRADETEDWVEMFSSIKKPEFGKYGILGNHDYGDYLEWPSEDAKLKNRKEIREAFGKFGFDLLRNENRIIKKENSAIRLIGVENWGKGGFQKYADLKKASTDVDSSEFKILLSHDPSHWDLKIQNNPFNYQLTMSGHTHGMQFGIEIPGIKWSPIQFRYPHWAGLYNNSNRYLYVNRGFGYLAFKGRVGIWPEISLIELKKNRNS